MAVGCLSAFLRDHPQVPIRQPGAVHFGPVAEAKQMRQRENFAVGRGWTTAQLQVWYSWPLTRRRSWPPPA